MSANQSHYQCHTGWKSLSVATIGTLPGTKRYLPMGLTKLPLPVSPLLLSHKQLLSIRTPNMAAMLHAKRGGRVFTGSPHYSHQELRQLTLSSVGYSHREL